MFADTDFLLALFKESDWLKKSAVKLLREHKGNIRTSVSVMIEVALLCKKLKMGVLEAFANIFELISVDDETYEVCMRAALYIQKYELNVFDAFHAAYCGNDHIISSDSAYEMVGIRRVKLGK